MDEAAFARAHIRTLRQIAWKCLNIQKAIPRVTDNDKGEITVSLDGRELRGWSYRDYAERRTKMLAAREYVEGWGDGREAS